MATAGVAGRTALDPPQSKSTQGALALIATGQTSRVVPATITNTAEVTVATQGTAADVTMTMSATLTGVVMQDCQPLSFYSPSLDRYFLASVRGVYTDANAATLDLRAAETIPADAVAQFPAPVRIRQSFDLAESVATTSFSSFDHTNSTQSIGDGTATLTATGGYSHYDAGLATAKFAKDNGQKLYFEQELESPLGTVYGTGLIQWGIAVVTAINTNSPDGGNVSGDFTLSVSGKINRIDPVT